MESGAPTSRQWSWYRSPAFTPNSVAVQMISSRLIFCGCFGSHLYSVIVRHFFFEIFC